MWVAHKWQGLKFRETLANISKYIQFVLCHSANVQVPLFPQVRVFGICCNCCGITPQIYHADVQFEKPDGISILWQHPVCRPNTCRGRLEGRQLEDEAVSLWSSRAAWLERTREMLQVLQTRTHGPRAICHFRMKCDKDWDGLWSCPCPLRSGSLPTLRNSQVPPLRGQSAPWCFYFRLINTLNMLRQRSSGFVGYRYAFYIYAFNGGNIQ